MSNGDGAEELLGEAPAGAVRRAAAEMLGCEPAQVDWAEVRRLSGGASRHTFLARVTAQQAGEIRFAVQRERAGTVGTNLGMDAQVGLLRSAGALGVPVPRVMASGGEPGEGFVVLEWLEGEAVPRRVMRDDALAAARTGLAHEAGRILAGIHRVEPAGHPALRADDPVAQMQGLLDMLGEPHPAFEIGLAWLAAHRPAQRAEVVVHGDFRMGNLLISPGGVTAVLDWELAHLGSPVEDLGWFCCKAWRFGSPMRAGGIGPVEALLDGYREGGGEVPDSAELDWWEAFGTLRWGLICVLQASVHLRGLHRSVELAAIGRRAAECEEDLLALVAGPSDYEPLPPPGTAAGAGPHDRPDAVELLDAVGEALVEARQRAEGSTAFDLRVSANVVAMVGREVALAPTLDAAHRARLDALGVADSAALAARVRSGGWNDMGKPVIELVRESVRDKLAVSNPGYWNGDT